jgi:hypothetical protein
VVQENALEAVAKVSRIVLSLISPATLPAMHSAVPQPLPPSVSAHLLTISMHQQFPTRFSMQDLAAGGSLGVSATASVVVVTDTTVWKWHGRRFERALQNQGVKALVKALPPGEHTKSRAYKEIVEDWMLENR